MKNLLPIKSAEFVISALKPSQYPTSLPQIAFCGRSNVGKSSLINCILNRKKLVKTSSTPGKTRLINFFKINDSFYFVDLPGYGYAKVSKKEREKWGPMIETYFKSSQQLLGTVVLLDIRHDPRQEEKNVIAWFEQYHIPYLIVLTKADKLSKSKQLNQHKRIADLLTCPKDSIIRFSAKTRQGKDDIWSAFLEIFNHNEGNTH
ncbi:MAG: GTP-binding protein [Candidatus Magnetoglobus multicellularis str. Araruama]|uniref:Probable GTP-binding protein EngB n=1 Tax=Candidatus Magnetoglobus multicellularis str. Araruama TaxID=890399 RepID=A0A1V1PIH3_9BACT|nr:MAG: GTP-binding protein [Candidatus Magnetoglobus multicellularis str. Araruama]